MLCCLAQTKLFMRKHRFWTRANVSFLMYVLCCHAQTLVFLRKHRFRTCGNVCFSIVFIPKTNAYICFTSISTECDKDMVVFRKFLHFAKLLLRTAVSTLQKVRMCWFPWQQHGKNIHTLASNWCKCSVFMRIHTYCHANICFQTHTSILWRCIRLIPDVYLLFSRADNVLLAPALFCSREYITLAMYVLTLLTIASYF